VKGVICKVAAGSCRQFLNLFPVQGFGEFLIAADRGPDDFSFAILQQQDLFLHRVASDDWVVNSRWILPNPGNQASLFFACDESEAGRGEAPGHQLVSSRSSIPGLEKRIRRTL
jgi:hypothetical protein